ncbi:MAG: UDP-N-acetylglucosamine 2-epimerase (non-hydrolyzing) [Firmicutes bacterium]|nr:UDP-N-acetylglucosamine 2-epimerase (non-hydrolyzing) [Bacillota bacterium]
MNKKVMLVFGTRPEAIKMAPLVKTLEADDRFETIVAVTAQHREMLDMVLELFSIIPDYDLNIMKQGQDLYDITSAVLLGLKPILREAKPDILLVHGDTTTTMAASLAGFYEGIPVGHVEAGLRTGNKLSPWPEEINRRITDVITDYYFAPTELNRENLLKENVPADKIFITGNTVIDALHMALERSCPPEECGLDLVDPAKKVILLTCHRRENWGEPMERIFAAVAKIVDDHEDIEVVFPVHKNPKVREVASRHLGNKNRVHMIEPLDYHPFSTLMSKAYLVLTDSGGIQEEAPSLGKPVLVLRDTTERPEAVAAGTVKLAGTYEDDIIREVEILLSDKKAYDLMAETKNPYGDGTSSCQIKEIIAENV